MAAGLTDKQIYDKLRYLKRKYPNTKFAVLRASSGEVSLVPKDWNGILLAKEGENRSRSGLAS